MYQHVIYNAFDVFKTCQDEQREIFSSFLETLRVIFCPNGRYCSPYFLTSVRKSSG